jgi:hypothetical protein
MEEKTCARCNTVFPCGGLVPKARCWCDEKPWVVPLSSPDAHCLCPACLDLEISSRQNAAKGGAARAVEDLNL